MLSSAARKQACTAGRGSLQPRKGAPAIPLQPQAKQKEGGVAPFPTNLLGVKAHMLRGELTENFAKLHVEEKYLWFRQPQWQRTAGARAQSVDDVNAGLHETGRLQEVVVFGIEKGRFWMILARSG